MLQVLNYLKNIQQVVFDKTGTLTTGKFAIEQLAISKHTI